MVDRAFMLKLSAPEMAALLGGMRAIGANAGDDNTDGILTDRPGQLTNDFFVNLIEMGTVWEPIGEGEERFEGKDRKTGETRWTATRVDLVFGSNSQLRAIAEEYAANGGEERMLDALRRGLGQGDGERPLRPPPLTRSVPPCGRPSLGPPGRPPVANFIIISHLLT
jgi:catalase-peroxidase